MLVIVLQPDNLERMRQADPFDVQARTLARSEDDPARRLWVDRPIRDLDIIVAYEEHTEAMLQFAEHDDLPGLLRYLERGRVHRPGDAEPPVPALP